MACHSSVFVGPDCITGYLVNNQSECGMGGYGSCTLVKSVMVDGRNSPAQTATICLGILQVSASYVCEPSKRQSPLVMANKQRAFGVLKTTAPHALQS